MQMNYLDMMPDDIQGLIMEFKEKKEVKYNRVMKLVKQKQGIEEKLRLLMTILYKIQDNICSDRYSNLYRNTQQEYESTSYAHATVKAWLELENQYEYEDPRDVMTITRYVMTVDRLRKNVIMI